MPRYNPKPSFPFTRHDDPLPPLAPPSFSCPQCVEPNPTGRMRHWISFADVEELKDHAQITFAGKINPLTGRSRVEDIAQIYLNEKHLWDGTGGGMPPINWETGEFISWQAARQQYYRAYDQQMRQEREKAAEKRQGQRKGSKETAEQQPQDAVKAIMARLATFAPPNNVWARGHIEMALHGYSRPGHEQEAVIWCRAMAKKYPQDARDWEEEARRYEQDMTGA